MKNLNFYLLQEYIDYWEYKKYMCDKPYSLKGRTVNSITRSVKNWHNRIPADYKRKIYEIGDWKGTTNEISYCKFKGVNYSFKEITSVKELLKESEEMMHCAYSYIDNCALGNTSVWSMKIEDSHSQRHHLTIEVRRRRIVQISGKYNSVPSELDNKVIRKWAKGLDYKYKGLQEFL